VHELEMQNMMVLHIVWVQFFISVTLRNSAEREIVHHIQKVT
jgi:hypothetical protein